MAGLFGVIAHAAYDLMRLAPADGLADSAVVHRHVLEQRGEWRVRRSRRVG